MIASPPSFPALVAAVGSLLFLLPGCQRPGEGDDDSSSSPSDESPCDAESLEPGRVSVRVDGEAWEGEGVYDAAGTLQINGSGEGTTGNLILDAFFTTEEDSAVASLSLLPATVLLGEGSQDGGAAQFQREGVTYITDSGHGGSLLLHSLEGEVLRGCFTFTAEATGGGETVSLAEGAFAVASFAAGFSGEEP